MISEQAKYESMWAHDAYRVVAPGEHHVQRFLELARPGNSATVCDFGCGTGRGAALIAALAQVPVTAVDFAANALDIGSSDLVRFLQHDLTVPLSERFDYGYCTDVMEHVPTADVDKVLVNITSAARKVYFAISTQPDIMGALIGEPLHLTVRDPFWWHDRLTSLGFRVDWSHYDDNLTCFYGSAYANDADFTDNSALNVPEDSVAANVRANLALGLKELEPHAPQPDVTVYLLAGGPSLADHEAQITEFGRSGGLIVTVNGTYNWLIERGIRPAAQFMVDARKFNSRFVTPVIDTCKYLISSQCDHDVLKSLPADNTLLWHSAGSDIIERCVRAYFDEQGVTHEWYPVHGGTTIITRALVALAMLGFRRIEVFGLDSCLRDDTHHAYPQPENDKDSIIEVVVDGGRKFRCHPWMLIQASDFQKTVANVLGKIKDFDMVIHGDGMIAHMLQQAASKAALSTPPKEI